MSDPSVTWSLPHGGGTITANGLFTAGCPTDLDQGSSVIVRATSTAVPSKFADAQVTVGSPIIISNELVTAGNCSRGIPGRISCGTGEEALDDGPNFAIPDGNNSVTNRFEGCACNNGTFIVPFTVFATSREGQNTGPCPGPDMALASADERIFFSAAIPTMVTITINKAWGAGSARITATETDSTGRNVQAVYQIDNNAPIQDLGIPPFQVPAGTHIAITVHAQCTGNSSGAGRAVTLTFAQ